MSAHQQDADGREGPARWSRARTPGAQDMPPKEGYPPIRTGRHLPRRGPHPLVAGAIITSFMTYGMYLVIQANKERRALANEKRMARRAIVPYLQAEEDARMVVETERLHKIEAEIMKNVPGWEVGKSVYHNPNPRMA
eukprot:CAMPEP_0114541382 /NCGR_PEP_ID=MMETSP0114-20121206/1276_1 /TAXON_ID=31324 /ORGANISM="Goniomonas sp, Strain m" /LENGTH=137 /DNA_ID=CAMNT_0001725617 /DNA_START=3 /DNA_END=416 /DNA_ORIENTATION=+